MLTAVPVHAHDETLLILDAHLVVDILLNAASEKALQERGENMEPCLFCTPATQCHGAVGLLLTLQPSQACTP